MKITIESREEFLKALDLGGAGLPKTHPVNPALAAVVLTVLPKGAHGGTGALAVSSYDSTTFADCTITAESNMSQGDIPEKILVNGNQLIAFVKNFPKGQPIILQVGKNSNKLEMRCQDYACNLPMMSLNEYPKTPNAPSSMAGIMEQHDFTKLIHLINIAASKDESLPILTGANITFDEKGIQAVATDRYRLVCVSVPWSNIGEDEIIPDAQKGSYLLKANVLHSLSRKSADYEFVGIHPPTNGEQVIKFTVRDTNEESDTTEGASATVLLGAVSTTLMEGDYPNTRALIPQNPVANARFDKTKLSESLSFVNANLPPNQPILLKFEDGSVEVSSDDNSGSTAKNKVPDVILNGAETLEIAFNPQYLIAAVNSFNTPQVEIRFADFDGLRPAYLVGVYEDGEVDESYIHLLMPVRRQNNLEER